MQISFFDVFITVISLVLMMIPGYLLVKSKVMPKSAGEVLSALVLYGCQPALMIMGFQKTKFNPEIAVNMLIVAGLAILIHAIMIALVMIVYRGKNDDKLNARLNCMKFASVFGNVGYMGIPFLTMLFNGSEQLGVILIYAAVIIGVFNILNWSVGIYMMSGDKKYISLKKAFLNPTVIAVFVGLLLFLICKKPIVDLAVEGSALDKILTSVIKAVNFLSDSVTPLAMIIIGVRFANVKFRTLFTDKWGYITCLNKLVVMSLVTILVSVFLPISVEIKYTLFFTLSMPSATATVMFAVKFGGDADSGSIDVLLTALMSIPIIPLMFLFFTNVFGGFL